MHFNNHAVLFNYQQQPQCHFKTLIQYLLFSTLVIQVIIHKNPIFIFLTQPVHTLPTQSSCNMVSEDWKIGIHATGLGLLCNLVQWFAWELRARA